MEVRIFETLELAEYTAAILLAVQLYFPCPLMRIPMLRPEVAHKKLNAVFIRFLCANICNKTVVLVRTAEQGSRNEVYSFLRRLCTSRAETQGITNRAALVFVSDNNFQKSAQTVFLVTVNVELHVIAQGFYSFEPAAKLNQRVDVGIAEISSDLEALLREHFKGPNRALRAADMQQNFLRHSFQPFFFLRK
jgi:hypothetical protein